MPYDVRPYRPRYPLDLIVAFARDLMDGSRRMDATGGDAVTAGAGTTGVLWLRHPDLVRALLVENNADVTKARGMRILSLLVGDGLLSSEVPKHTRQRRLVLPAFHHARLRAYGEVMTAQSRRTAGLWRAAAEHGEAVDVGEAMNHLALAIAGETLFGSGMERDAARIGRALDESMAAFDKAQFPYADRLLGTPLPNVRRGKRARAVVDDVVYGVIAERKAAARRASGEAGPSGDGSPPEAPEDLLEMLLDARDEDTGEPMTDEEVRDEAVTLLMAGHETTANALAWTWALLAEQPGAEAALHDEVDALGRDPHFGDLRDGLPVTRAVFSEAMRLLPPAWIFSREAAHDFRLAGEVPVSKGTMVLVAPYFLHRDDRLWREPERFDLGRWTPEARAGRHKFAYLPFSAGRRGCIGEPFAWAEGVLALATIARRWRLALEGPRPRPHGSVTLRPGTPLRMKPIPRGGVTQG